MTARRRWPARLAGALATGAALTLAAAWTAAIASRVVSYEMHTLHDDAQRLATSRHLGGRVRVPDDWTVRTWLERLGPGVRHDTVSECEWMGSALAWSDATSPNRTMIRFSAGWPFPALQLTLWDAGPTPLRRGVLAVWHEGVAIPGISMGSAGSGVLNPRRLPLRPLWPGFAADVLLWTAAAWGLNRAWRLRRSRVRRRRGQCEDCGYPRGGLPKCPECGKV